MSIADMRQGTTLRWTARRRDGFGLTDSLATLLQVVKLWRKRARDRAELARMGYLALQDLGIPDPDIAWQEAKRPFWRDAQESWREIAAARSRQIGR